MCIAQQVTCATVRTWMLKNSTESGNMTWILANTKPCPQCKCVVFGLGGRAGGWFGISACQGLAIERTVAPVAGSLCLGLDLPCHTVWMYAKGKKTSMHTAALFLDAYGLLNPPPRPTENPCRRPIEKNQGCMHMTCSQCQYEFCWLCLRAWATYHNQGTGGFYACNKYAVGRGWRQVALLSPRCLIHTRPLC